MIKLDLSRTKLEALTKYVEFDKIKQIHSMIHNKTGKGSDYLGWVDWPTSFDKEEYNRMKIVAAQLREKIEVLLVTGIGGSYLGTRAANDMIRGLYSLDKVELIYVGNTMSSTYLSQVLDYVKNKKFGIVNVSKSGTTTEPGISFRVFEKALEDKVGTKTAKELIVAVTDKAKGALKKLADQKEYQSFVIPDDIGGRFSVLTPVGIFPLLVAGINTDLIFAGAKKAEIDLQNEKNSAYEYAVARFALNTKLNYKVETLVTYELQMQFFSEWWKQLFGESEGKEGKGLMPTSVVYSTDLHSLGQFIQEGTKNLLFETVIKINDPTADLNVPANADDLDGLNYLTSKSFHAINSVAIEGVLNAHEHGGVPNIVLEFEKMDEEMFGYAVYWFEKAVAMSAYLLDVNPFDQPGVEIYKKNMFRLLGKPGIN